MATPKIFESEYRFCLILWEREPVSSAELAKICKEKLGWSRTTTVSYTHLDVYKRQVQESVQMEKARHEEGDRCKDRGREKAGKAELCKYPRAQRPDPAGHQPHGRQTHDLPRAQRVVPHLIGAGEDVYKRQQHHH